MLLREQEPSSVREVHVSLHRRTECGVNLEDTRFSPFLIVKPSRFKPLLELYFIFSFLDNILVKL